ncbi:serine/threonine protein phosphatase [Streptomyces spongiicola]|uniref:Serine/threonine protein phosphatase n=1 Tax=Streptomyces spongiicola TaxID=1690221 RepID=A0ABM6V7V3_9ACTN|nr:metallophosphoesterase [Streptomyces spongiicola]AWK10076.1 serine/threonine protein phosphatase [Streptomyces spongiicola]
MTQGAGQGPVVRTATLRDFRVPPYAQVPVQSQPCSEEYVLAHPEDSVPQPVSRLPGESAPQPAPADRSDDPDRADATDQADDPDRGDDPGQADDPGRPAPAAEAADGGPGTAPDRTGDSVPQAPQAPRVHPGDAVPDDEPPEGYTPTQRDLPVVNRGDTVLVAAAPAQQPAPEGLGPLYVVGDVHGYLDELVAALAAQGLIDSEGHWSAGNTRLWFLGDFTDRGPDGIGVIDLVMRLSAEAAAAGGYCKALMGNHELLIIGARRFGDTPVNSGAGTATFQAAWLLNGGQKNDMDRLQDVHLQWMSRLDAVVEEDGHLLMHSDTTAYLDYGTTIEDVNDTVHEIINRNDADECWDLFRKFTKRFAFRDDNGPQAVRELLATYGGGRVVHGHSPIPYLLGEVGAEDADGEENSEPLVEGPHVYADGLAVAMDGGVTMAGRLLVAQLPLEA